MTVLKPLYFNKKPKRKRHDPFYDLQRWRKLTVSHRKTEPLCRLCMARGIVTPGTLVDHIVPINQGGSRWDEDNLQTLCDRCHQIKRAGEK
jgi:5-methylcytosine-specific restriction endonuclease McrA